MSGENSTELQVVRAFTTIIVFAAISDGKVTEEEQNIIINVLARMNTFNDYQEELKPLLGKCLQSLMLDTRAALTESIASLPYELHDVAFAVSADIVMSDGKVTKKEEATLDLLANKLSVPKSKAQQIIEVMRIKNRG